MKRAEMPPYSLNGFLRPKDAEAIQDEKHSFNHHAKRITDFLSGKKRGGAGWRDIISPGGEMSFFASAGSVARILVKLSPVIAHFADNYKKWKKRDAFESDGLSSRIERIEKNMEIQANLNEQIIGAMEIMKGLHGSLRIAFSLSVVALAVSLIAIAVAVFK